MNFDFVLMLYLLKQKFLVAYASNNYNYNQYFVRNICVVIKLTHFIGVGTYKEPIPGWIDNFNGPTAAVVGAFVGILRTFYADVSKKANVIPVDMSINALIASAWDIANRPRYDFQLLSVRIISNITTILFNFLWKVIKVQ